MNKATGVIKKINDKQTVSRANNMDKQTFVIVTEDDYPQTLLIETIKHGTDQLKGLKVGDKIIADVEIRGREWINPEGESKFFMSLQTWKIHNANDVSTTETDRPIDHETPLSEEQDDLPF